MRGTLTMAAVMATIPRIETALRGSITAVLAVREPQTVKELCAAVGRSNLSNTLAIMAKSGQVVRSRYGRSTYYYARSSRALRAFLPERPNGVPRRRTKTETRLYSMHDQPIGHTGDISSKEIDRRYAAALKTIRARREQGAQAK